MNDASEVPGYEWARVAKAIEGRIESGELAPGERLPSLVALGEEYGVARNTAQRAVKDLADRGLVTVLMYRGTFIATRD